jgi:hypothetical protein
MYIFFLNINNFYNVKKKFNQMSQRTNKSLEVHNSSFGRNNYKVKSLIKNYSVILPKIEKRTRTIKNSPSSEPTTKIYNYSELNNKKF